MDKLSTMDYPEITSGHGTSSAPHDSEDVQGANPTGPFDGLQEITVRLDRLPVDVTKTDIFHWLSKHGDVAHISIFDPRVGEPCMAARVVFAPPPVAVFWQGDVREGSFAVEHQDNRRVPAAHEIHLRVLPSKQIETNASSTTSKQYPINVSLGPTSMSFGNKTDHSVMTTFKTVQDDDDATDNLKLDFNIKSRRMTVFFPFVVTNHQGKKEVTQCKFVADLSLLKDVLEVGQDEGEALVFSFPQPPQYFYKHQNNLSSLSTDKKSWSVRDFWVRITDIVQDPETPMAHPVSLCCAAPDLAMIDIGRWTSFCFTIPTRIENARQSLSHLKEMLHDLNVKFRQGKVEATRTNPTDNLWRYLDHQPMSSTSKSSELLTSSM
jgi:hypothetical protein